MTDTLTSAIKDQTQRALWEVQNTIACIPIQMWNEKYCGMPLFKHVYHTLHSLDQWFVNPKAYAEPPMHAKDLNNLDMPTDVALSRAEIDAYFESTKRKVEAYLHSLTDEMLTEKPDRCEWTRFTLMLAQMRHLHTHMGMIMGFIVAKTEKWPFVLGLTRELSGQPFGTFF